MLTAGLRFPNLGYSDYHGDEFKAFISAKSGDTVWQFFLSQRKGPMQFVVSYLPYLVTHDFTNELAQRIPFATASCLASVAFFLFVYKFTKNWVAAFVASFLMLANGYITGFGRIAQYQNLNLLFSFTALWAYAHLRDRDINQKSLRLYSLIGTGFWCLSILAHWDAVLIFPVVVLLTYRVFANRIRLALLNIVLGMLLLAPFVIPYLTNLGSDNRNQAYLFDRIGLDIGYSKVPLYKALTELYNPYVVLPFLLFTSLVSLCGIKKYYPIVIWFLGVFGCFELLVKNPGTHIYNFILPIFILSGIGVSYIVQINKYLNFFVVPIIFTILAFIYVQTYVLFVDHTKEYPYETKAITFLGRQYKAEGISEIKPVYMRGSYIPLFGFPHQRFWNEINDFINAENLKNHENLRFITNEDKAFCDNYMDSQYGVGQSYYAVGIKRPTNFVADYSFSNIGSKSLVAKYSHNNETVVKIYKVRGK